MMWPVITGGVGVCVAGRLSPATMKVKLVLPLGGLSVPVFGKGGRTGIGAASFALADFDLTDFCLAASTNPAMPAPANSNTNSVKNKRKRVVIMSSAPSVETEYSSFDETNLTP